MACQLETRRYKFHNILLHFLNAFLPVAEWRDQLEVSAPSFGNWWRKSISEFGGAILTSCRRGPTSSYTTIKRCMVSGVTGGEGRRGAECPQRFLTGNFLLTYREKTGKGKGEKIEKKRMKMVKRKVENWKWKNGSRKSYKRWWGLFAFHFWKRRKFVLGLPKG